MEIKVLEVYLSFSVSQTLAQVGVLFKSTNWSVIDLPRLNWSVILEVYILGLLS